MQKDWALTVRELAPTVVVERGERRYRYRMLLGPDHAAADRSNLQVGERVTVVNASQDGVLVRRSSGALFFLYDPF